MPLIILCATRSRTKSCLLGMLRSTYTPASSCLQRQKGTLQGRVTAHDRIFSGCDHAGTSKIQMRLSNLAVLSIQSWSALWLHTGIKCNTHGQYCTHHNLHPTPNVLWNRSQQQCLYTIKGYVHTEHAETVRD